MRTETSHIWLGQFVEGAKPKFFVERLDRDDDEPLSQFGESQGVNWYNHDSVEISFLKNFVNVRDLVTGHSYSEQYLEDVLAAAGAADIQAANVFVLASEDQFPSAISASGEDYKLCYLGKFTYNI